MPQTERYEKAIAWWEETGRNAVSDGMKTPGGTITDASKYIQALDSDVEWYRQNPEDNTCNRAMLAMIRRLYAAVNLSKLAGQSLYSISLRTSNMKPFNLLKSRAVFVVVVTAVLPAAAYSLALSTWQRLDSQEKTIYAQLEANLQPPDPQESHLFENQHWPEHLIQCSTDPTPPRCQEHLSRLK